VLQHTKMSRLKSEESSLRSELISLGSCTTASGICIAIVCLLQGTSRVCGDNHVMLKPTVTHSRKGGVALAAFGLAAQ
jgi:hypothetical protein